MLYFLKRIAPWLAAIMLYLAGYSLGYDKAETHYKEVMHNEYVTKQIATQRTQQEVSRISKDYQDTIAGIEGSTDRIINDLRNDNKRLRVKLKPQAGVIRSDGGCESASTGELDESTAKRLIGITERGDAQIDALIKTVKALQADNDKLSGKHTIN